MSSTANVAFDLSLQASTSGWYNNCGANCLANFITAELLSGEFDKRENSLFLRCFDEYYSCPGWGSPANIRMLLKRYPHPLDREKILAPVLRVYLKYVLLEASLETSWNALPFKEGVDVRTATEDLLNHGDTETLFRDYFNAEKNSDAESNCLKDSRIQANLGAISGLKAEYQAKIKAFSKEEISEQEKTDAIKQLRTETYPNNPTMLALLNNQPDVLQMYLFDKIKIKRIKEMKMNGLEDVTDYEFYTLVKLNAFGQESIQYIDGEPTREEIDAEKDLLKETPEKDFARILLAKDPQAEIAKIKDEIIAKRVLDPKKALLLQQYWPKFKELWDKTGYEKYAIYVSKMSNRAMLTDREILLICKKMGINAKIYTKQNPNTPQCDLILDNQPGAIPREIKFINLGTHWEFEMKDAEKLIAHETLYTSNPTFKKNVEARVVQKKIHEKISTDLRPVFPLDVAPTAVTPPTAAVPPVLFTPAPKPTKPQPIVATTAVGLLTEDELKPFKKFMPDDKNNDQFEKIYNDERGTFKQKFIKKPDGRESQILLMEDALRLLKSSPSPTNLRRVKAAADTIIQEIDKEKLIKPIFSSMKQICRQISKSADDIIKARAGETPKRPKRSRWNFS